MIHAALLEPCVEVLPEVAGQGTYNTQKKKEVTDTPEIEDEVRCVCVMVVSSGFTATNFINGTKLLCLLHE